MEGFSNLNYTRLCRKVDNLLSVPRMQFSVRLEQGQGSAVKIYPYLCETLIAICAFNQTVTTN